MSKNKLTLHHYVMPVKCNKEFRTNRQVNDNSDLRFPNLTASSRLGFPPVGDFELFCERVFLSNDDAPTSIDLD